MNKYKSYPQYKNSGIEWLGEIPEHWNTSRLKFLCNITTGGKDTENKIDDGKYPFYVRSQTIEKINSYSYNGEAILTAGDGVGVGKVFHYATGKFDFHQRVYMFYSFKKVAGKFLFEYIKNNFYKVALAGVAKSTVDSLRLPLIQNFMITVPPLEEQKAIANYLDKATVKIDTLIEKQEKLIELLKEKRQALISHAVTKGLNPDVKMKDSGVEWLGEIPAHWEVKKLKYNATLQTTKVKITNQQIIALENIEGWSGRYVATDSKYQGDDVSFQRGDILFGKLRPYLAKVYKCDNNGVAFGDILVYRPNQFTDSTFIFHTMISEAFIDIVDGSTYGSKMPRASVDFVSDMPMATPPRQEQEQIAKYLNDKTSKIDMLTNKATKAIELLKEKRTALISAVVTGKIDVREDTL